MHNEHICADRGAFNSGIITGLIGVNTVFTQGLGQIAFDLQLLAIIAPLRLGPCHGLVRGRFLCLLKCSVY